LAKRNIHLDGLGEDYFNQCAFTDIEIKDNKNIKKKSTGDKKITICHIPPGNSENKKNIEVAEKAARVHLAHGDILGRCAGEDEDDGEQEDKIPPVISSIKTTASTTSAFINWITNEEANSKIIYATETLNIALSTVSILNNNMVLNHSLELNNLATTTQYYFRIESTDAAGNTATSSEKTFITL